MIVSTKLMTPHWVILLLIPNPAFSSNRVEMLSGRRNMRVACRRRTIGKRKAAISNEAIMVLVVLFNAPGFHLPVYVVEGLGESSKLAS